MIVVAGRVTQERKAAGLIRLRQSNKKKGVNRQNKAKQMKTKLSKLTSATMLALATLLVASPEAQADGGRSKKTGIFPPHSRPYGKTYGEWAVRWWQWAFSIPGDRNPLTDMTGEFAGEGQSGPVWFVAGTFGDNVERSSTVPAGKALLLPVYTVIFGAGVFDCDPTVPGVPCVVCELQETAAANTSPIQMLEVTIDGRPVKNVSRYRTASPGPFPIYYPENSVTGVPEGDYFPQVTDGYWLMLEPLPEGEHEIVFSVTGDTPYFGHTEYTVIHNLTVVGDDDDCEGRGGRRR